MAEIEVTNKEANYDDDIDLMHIVRMVWAGKWFILIFTVVSAAIAIVFALSLPNIYRAEALLAPNQEKPGGNLQQYGGLASLAGINLDGGSVDKTALGLEILKSRKFVSQFIERHDILVPLLASESWDMGSGNLSIDPSIYDVNSKKWVREASPPKSQIPSSLEAVEEFKRILGVRQDKNSSIVTISIDHYDPALAKQWVDWLIQDINSSVMTQEVTKAERAIAFLKKQVESTSVVELQDVFYSLIEEQTKTVMLAKVAPEYLLVTIDPAVVPELKAKPKRSLIVLFGIFIGAVLGLIVSYYYYIERRPAVKKAQSN